MRDGHQEAQLALGKDWGLVARVDYFWPFLLAHQITADAGVSYYFANSDQGQPEFGGHIPVNLWMETGMPGLFAAGDIRADSARQVASAVGDGVTAAIRADHYLTSISPVALAE